MKEWILENTDVTEEEYDKLINLNTVTINGQKSQKTYEFTEHPIYDINLFTLERDSLLNRLKHQIKRTKINKKKLYECDNIEFYILSDFLKTFEDILYSTVRLNQCFHLNYEICMTLQCNSLLITALCDSPYRKNKQFLHTFILVTTNNNQEYIVDGTINIIIKKDTYYNIFKPQIISSISKEKLQEDKPFIKPLEKQKFIYKGEYYCFRDKVLQKAKK